MSPRDARTAALRDFGGIERRKDEVRETRRVDLVEHLIQDVTYAARGLRRSPGFTLAVIVTLALGVGANAAMFGIVDRLLFRPPPFLREPGRVHRLYEVYTANRTEAMRVNLSYARYRDLAQHSRETSTVAAFSLMHIAVGDGDAARERPVMAASATYFDLYDAPPALGRYFTSAEDSVPAGAPVAVLGYGYWKSEYGGRRDVIGQTVRVNQTLCTIIGVTPEHFAGVEAGEAPVLYWPLTTRAADARPGAFAANYGWRWPEVLVKRKEGISQAAATTELTAALRASWITQASANPNNSLSVETAKPHVLLGPVHLQAGPLAGPETRVITWVTGVAVIVLLIACANVANLLLVRAVSRRREIAMRLALGAGRGRLVRQLLTESLLLASLGGTAGILLAGWGGVAIRALFIRGDLDSPTIADGRTIAVALVATLLAAVLTGLAPALQALRHDLAHALRTGARQAGAERSRLRPALLLFQTTLSVVLLIGAGLFVRSLLNVRSMPLGYDINPLMVITDNTRGMKMSGAELASLETRLAELARTTPGVVAATPAASVPFWGFDDSPVFVPGVDSVSRLGSFGRQAGNADYFRTLGTRIVRGRGLDSHDDAHAPRVAVVSEGMARTLWPGQDALGKCIRLDADTMPCTSVVGVAQDVRVRSLKNQHEYLYYVPIAQYGDATGMLFVRSSGDASSSVETVRRALQAAMPGNSYITARPFSAIVDPVMASWRLGATMFVTFGMLALALAAVGLYSVIAYGVAQRRQEFGVRIALGARISDVLQLVVGEGLRLGIAGVILGAAIAIAGGRWIAPLLFDESPRDLFVFAAVAAVLLLAALSASLFPALRATRVDPVQSLRSE
jgi:predicted permease